jgi:hypothetical protein
MSETPDWEERCTLALNEIDRTDLDVQNKLERVRSILNGELENEASEELISTRHDWREVSVEELPGIDEASPGETVRYECRKCGAKGYRIVLPTSVTLYPIVTDALYCRPTKPNAFAR